MGQKGGEKMEECLEKFTMACPFKNIEDGYQQAFLAVCGPNLDKTRRLLWDELEEPCSIWDLPLCICNDFNVTRFSSE